MQMFRISIRARPSLPSHTGVVDAETAGAYSIKRFKERTEHGERVEAMLVPVNQDYSMIGWGKGLFVHDCGWIFAA